MPHGAGTTTSEEEEVHFHSIISALRCALHKYTRTALVPFAQTQPAQALKAYCRLVPEDITMKDTHPTLSSVAPKLCHRIDHLPSEGHVHNSWLLWRAECEGSSSTAALHPAHKRPGHLHPR